MREISFTQAMEEAMIEEMQRDERVIALATTRAPALENKFGDRRVRFTPISEAAFTGIGLGAAGSGFRPVVHWGMVTFSFVAMDQIVNQASKIRYMFGGQANFPVTYRCTTGGGAQTAAQHSQSPYSMFMHLAGLKIILPSTPADAKGLLKSAIRDDNPVIFIEAETLYAVKGEVPEDPEFLIPLGQAVIRREGTDVTVVAYMGMMYRALEVAEELAKEGISVEIVDPRTLRPMDTGTIIGSVRKTHRAVVLEAGAGFAGMGSEIAAEIQEEAFDDLDAPVERVTGENAPMPYAKNLELLKTPSKAKIAAVIRRVCSA
jgi:pyruvate dehydrogenase E1 component beta subunit